MPLGQRSSRRPSPRPPRTAFWARLLPQQLHGTARCLQLGLELSDAPVGCDQLRLLLARQSEDEPLVDPVLAAPGVDRLLADVEVVRDLRNASTLLEQVKDLA